MKTAPKMRAIYLHGFASSPASRKARFFVEKLAGHGLALEALDLAPDFEHLTISGQLAVIEKASGNDAVILIGSSLGGYLAALYASRHRWWNGCYFWRPPSTSIVSGRMNLDRKSWNGGEKTAPFPSFITDWAENRRWAINSWRMRENTRRFRSSLSPASFCMA
jgi:pimeloyl-ACP methyl ester carboxylesterase